MDNQQNGERDMAVFVESLLQDMQGRFTEMSSTILNRSKSSTHRYAICANHFHCFYLIIVFISLSQLMRCPHGLRLLKSLLTSC